MNPSIHFRPAVREDVSVAVPLIYSSGPAAFDFIFHHSEKRSAKSFLEKAFLRTGGEMGYGNHVVMEVDGMVTAIGAEWSGRKTLRYTLSIAFSILRFYGIFAGLKVMLRGLRFEQMVRPPSRNESVIAHIGVAKERWGKGYGRQLMSHLMQRAQRNKTSAIVLDVSIENSRARSLYLQLGFTVVSSTDLKLTRSEIDVSVPGHERMVFRT